MILVRDVFRLKFGKARDALAVWKDMGQVAARMGWERDSLRVCTDLVGPYYTLVIERTFPDLGSWEREMQKGMSDPQWREVYQKFTPLVEGGHREVFTVHDI